MSRVIQVAAAAVYGAYSGDWTYFVASLAGAEQDRKQRSQRRQAIKDANARARDRLEMADLQPRQPRTLAMGTVRAVEGIRRRWSSGEHDSQLTMIVSLCGHRISAIHQLYFDDVAIAVDGAGWVQTEPYLKGRRESGVESFFVVGGGAGSGTLPHTPITGTVQAVYRVTGTGGASGGQQPVPVFSATGANYTYSGLPADSLVWITYEYTVGTSHARVRTFMGGPTQNIAAAVMAEYPGKLQASDRGAFFAAMLLDLKFDPDVFPQGRPTATAVFDGAFLYDPRKDSTVPGGSGAHRWADESTWQFSRNPALQALRYQTWPQGGNIPIEEIRLDDVMRAADVCDVPTEFTLRKPDGSTETVTLPRYRCGIVCTGEDPDAELAAIMETMAGREGWDGGVWRMRAGVCSAPVATLTPDWIAVPLDDSGQPASEAAVQITKGTPGDMRVNRVSGSCIDPAQRWQMLPYPAVEDPVLIAAKGEAETERDYEGVDHPAHAQHLGTVAIRQAQASLRMQVSCNINAWRLELFDVVELRLPRYGMTAELAKLAEVTSRRVSPTEGVVLGLAEISQDIFDPVAELRGRDPAPDSALRRPWEIQALTGLAVFSGTLPTQDGSVITRTVVEWDPATQPSIRQGGAVEVQYIEVGADIEDGADWPSWTEQGTSSRTPPIPGWLAGRFYRVRARFVQLQPLVKGDWCAVEQHQVAQAPEAGAYVLSTGLAAVLLPANSAGVVSSYAGATFTPRVQWAGLDDTAAWTITRTNGPGLTTTLVAGVITVTALVDGTDATYVDVSATRTGFAPLVARVPVAKTRAGAAGSAGTSGLNSLRVQIFRRNALPTPSPPTDPVTVTFATGGVAGLPGVWSTVPQPSDGTALWTSFASAVGSGPTDVIAPGDWTTPVVLVRDGANGDPGEDGDDGAPAINNATVLLFQRTATLTPPPVPSATVIYNFVTLTASFLSEGWAQSLPPAGGDYVWMTSATAASLDLSDDIPPSGWAEPSLWGQGGASGFSVYTGTVYRQQPTAPAAPTGGSFNFSTAELLAPVGWLIAQPTTTSVPTWVAEFTFKTDAPDSTVAGGTWSAPVVDAVAGADGYSRITMEIYLQSGSAPAAPTGGSYTFSTDTLTPPVGWTRAMPPSTTTPTYRSVFNFSTLTPTVPVAGGAWGSPTVVARNGDNGAAGVSNALVKIFQRAASPPALPSATVTYTFASAGISGLNNGWQATPPAGSNPLYVAVATASSSGPSDTIASGEWAGPVIDSQNGLNNAPLLLFQRTATNVAPSLPSVNVTYTFSNGVATGVNNGWSRTLPATGGPFRWFTSVTALSVSDTDTITPGEWAEASKLAEDGAQGPVGNKVVRVYRRSLNAPSTPTGNGVPTGWFVAPPAADGNRLWMSEAEQTSAGLLVGVWSAPVASDATPGPAPVTFGVSVESLEVNTGVNSNAYVRFNADGTIDTRSGNGGAWIPAGSWYAPTTAGIGASFQMRTVLAVGDLLAFGAVDTWQPLTSGLIFRLEQEVFTSFYVQKLTNLQHYVAAAGSTNVLGQGVSFMTAIYDPAL